MGSNAPTHLMDGNKAIRGLVNAAFSGKAWHAGVCRSFLRHRRASIGMNCCIGLSIFRSHRQKIVVGIVAGCGDVFGKIVPQVRVADMNIGSPDAAKHERFVDVYDI